MGELTDNMENKLTKHNTENSNNVQHEPHCLKPCELTDNMENKLTKHNTENSNNVQHEPHCLKPWVNSLTTWRTS